MAKETPDFVDAVWKHCVGYLGVSDPVAFVAYMKRCQIKTTFFFADVNDRTVEQTRKALRTQSALAHFIERHQGKTPAEMQHEFGLLLQAMARAPLQPPGGGESHRMPGGPSP